MPAETHQHAEPANTEQVVELVLTIAGADEQPVTEVTTLADVGVDGELAIYDVLTAVAEELGERNLTPEEPDLDHVGPATTLFAFAEIVIGALQPHHQGRPDQGGR